MNIKQAISRASLARYKKVLNRRLTTVAIAAFILIVVVLGVGALLLSRGISTTDFISQTKPQFEKVAATVGSLSKTLTRSGNAINFREIIEDGSGAKTIITSAQTSVPISNSQTDVLSIKLKAYYSSTSQLFVTVEELQDYANLTSGIVENINNSLQSNTIDTSTPAGVRMLASQIQTAVLQTEPKVKQLASVSSENKLIQAFISATRPVITEFYEAGDQVVILYSQLADAAEAQDDAQVAQIQAQTQQVIQNLTDTRSAAAKATDTARSAIIDDLNKEVAYLEDLQVEIVEIYDNLN